MATDNRRKGSKKKSSDAPATAGRTAGPPRRTEPAAPGDVGATSGIPVITLGGSAGALESFNAFFEAMPADSGAAFVVIQHLAPAHASLLTELLAQRTTMKVVEAQEDAPVEPNCVYIIPPGKYLAIRDGVLSLSEPVMQGGIRMAIDFFFRSLAEDRQKRAVSVSTVPMLEEGYANVYGREITERKQADREKQLAMEFLQVVNASANLESLIRAAATFFHEKSGCEAVGIRLKEGDDYPYFETRGFPEEFVQLENSLCQRDLEGQVQRDEAGHPVLACMCGNVICGRCDPSKPFFTPAGSFWTNGTTELLAGTTEADRQASTRNRCNGQGYESVALVALRTGAERLGLLQLNDRRKNMFTPQDIALWERLGGYLAVALAKVRAEAALAAQHAELQLILDAAPASIFYKDCENRFVRVNRAFAEIMGRSREELEGRALLELFPAAQAEAFHRDDLEVIASGRPKLNIVEPMQTPAGELWLQTDKVPCRDATGNIIGVIGFALDITERKWAEDALQRSESILRAITDNSPDPMFLKDRQCRLIFANPATALAIGKPAAEIVGKTDEEFYDDPAIGRAITDNDRRIMETGQDETVEEVIPNPDGSNRIFLSTKSLFRDAQDRIVGIVGVARDITKRKQAEEALRQSEERYRTMFATMLEGFCIIEVLFDAQNRPVDYRFLEINPAFEAQTGLHDAQGKRMLELAPDHEAHWFEIYGKVALTGEPAHFTNRAKALNRWFDVSAYRVGGPESHKVAILFSDITEREKALENLRQAAAELARSNKELEQFAYVASHDLQEPLRGVIGFTNLLKERYQGKLDARADEYIGFAVEGATRMNALILDLLSYSRVGAKGQTLAPTDLEAPLFRALGNLKTSIEESGAEVTRDELPTVPADPGLITQLFQNLISNAIKFHSDKKPEIHVGAELKDGQWHISVRDNGIGLDMKHQDRIFQIFQRLHARDVYPGTGIGLAICKKIVEGHGGRIWVESHPGQGTTFYFTLSA